MLVQVFKNSSRVCFVVGAIAVIVVIAIVVVVVMHRGVPPMIAVSEQEVPLEPVAEPAVPIITPPVIIEPEKIIEPTAPEAPFPVVVVIEPSRPTEPAEPVIVGLEPKYFGQGTLLPLSPDLHPSIKAIVGFNVPVGTPVFMLFDGYVLTAGAQFKDKMGDFLVMHRNPEGHSLIDSLKNTNIRVEVDAYKLMVDVDDRLRKINQGEVIARVISAEAIKDYAEQGSFNVTILFQAADLEAEQEIQRWVKLLIKR